MPKPALESLTPREREILIMIGEGDSLPEIAQKLHRSLKTIESHRLSIGRKLNASNRVELAKIAISAGLVSITDPTQAEYAAPTVMDHHWAATELAWLEQINTAVEMAVGGDYLRRFCLAASQLPGVNVAAVCTPDPMQQGEPSPYLRCVMAAANNGEALDPVRYDAHQTPCQQIIEEGVCLFERDILKAYPHDQLLQHFQAEGYVGVRLSDDKGKAVGGLGVIGSQPMKDLSRYQRVLEFFAPRVAAELEQHKRVEQMRQEQNQLLEQLRLRTLELEQTRSDDWSSAMNQLSQRVEHHVGGSFIRELTDALCDVFAVQYAGICMPDIINDEQWYQSVALSHEGNQAEPVRIPSANVPCVALEHSGFVCCERDAPSRFPNATLLVEGNHQAYIGIRLVLPNAKLSGSFWIVSTEPVNDTLMIEHALRHYAPRAAAEIDQILQVQRLKAVHDRLQEQIDDRDDQLSEALSAAEGGKDQSALLRVQQRVSHLAGPGFIRAVTDALCDTFAVRYAGVCRNELIDNKPGFNAISLSEQGEQIDTMRYHIAGTPCEKTIESGFFCCPADVTKQFSDDQVLIDLQVDSYIGICLDAQAAGRIGILWVIDSNPIADPQSIESVMRHLAPRLSSELNQFIEFEELRLAHERLEQVIAGQG